MDSLSENDSVRFSEDFQQLAQHLRKPETFDLPSYHVEVDLRPYQEEEFNGYQCCITMVLVVF